MVTSGMSLSPKSPPTSEPKLESLTSDAEEPPLKKPKQTGDGSVDQPMKEASEKLPSEKGVDDEAQESSSDEESSDENNPTLLQTKRW
jgi:hypothetical protein